MGLGSVFDAVDLHTHSTVSDGTDSPAQLLRVAAAAGLTAIALTDHDVTDGWVEAAATVPATGVALIPGIELSTRYDEHGSIHVLGYGIDPTEPRLVAELATIRAARVARAERLVEKLSAVVPISWEDVVAHAAPGVTIGRPHIADALIARGVVRDRSDAFARLLSPRGGFVESYPAPHPVEGVGLIREAGGVAVLAHPASRAAVRSLTETRLMNLARAGLFGLELDHPENIPEHVPPLRDLAARLGLAVTGSSDYHGTGKRNRIGQCRTPADTVIRLLAATTGTRIVLP